MTSNIQTYCLGQGKPDFFDTFPLPPRPTGEPQWADIFDLFPFPNVFRAPGFLARLTGSEPLARPYHLQGDTSAHGVNEFLRSVNRAFDRGPTGGPRTVERECAGASRAALQTAFGDDAPLYGDFQHVVSGISSAVQGGLALVSVGPNLTWAQSHKSKDFEQRLAGVDEGSAEHAQLVAERDAAREAHRSGSADWHDIVVYIVNKRCFVYDPSALTVNTGSDTGKEIWRRLNADDAPRGGYDVRMLVNVAPAARIWATGFSNAKGARFRKPANASGAWIGGGGNWATAEDGGDCRGMCGNFIVLAHALQWAWQRGVAAGLDDEQREQAAVNLDWLLGGNLTGGGNGARGQRLKVRWEPVRMH